LNSQRRYRMRNIHKALIAVFCSGIFITGIGTGIALSEFSSFAYSGKTTIGDVKMVTENLDYSFQLQEDQKLRIYGNYFFYSHSGNPTKIIPDETVPENTVRFQITYNEQAVSPYLRDSEQESEDPFVGIEFAYLQNDMELFLAGKEQLLDDIKNRRIGSYETVSVDRIRIFVNPASADLVIMD
jgi:hypothetical protein